MLAALLLNLFEEEEKRRRKKGVALTIVFDERKAEAKSAAERIDALLQASGNPQVEALQKKAEKAARKVAEVNELPTVELSEFSEVNRQLSMVLFELRQSQAVIQEVLDEQAQAEFAQVMLTLANMQAALLDEEDALVLLLST